MQLIPPPLKKRSTLGVVGFAGQLQDKSRFEWGVRLLEEMGFSVFYPRDLWPGQGYLADSDANRAEEFHRMLRMPEIEGIISLRGGYGCLRLLEHLDLDLLRAHPKRILGFSDLTVLFNHLYVRCGFVSLHGPVLTSLNQIDRPSLHHCFHALTKERFHPIDVPSLEILREGKEMHAPVIGGNLASLLSMVGTCYDFPWDDKILLLEDINEPMYKIDRMLTQLRFAEKLDNLAGLILGDFSLSSADDAIAKLRYQEMIWNRLLELCGNSSYPIWADFPIGHGTANMTFPLGATAVMNSSKRQLQFDF